MWNRPRVSLMVLNWKLNLTGQTSNSFNTQVCPPIPNQFRPLHKPLILNIKIRKLLCFWIQVRLPKQTLGSHHGNFKSMCEHFNRYDSPQARIPLIRIASSESSFLFFRIANIFLKVRCFNIKKYMYTYILHSYYLLI